MQCKKCGHEMRVRERRITTQGLTKVRYRCKNCDASQTIEEVNILSSRNVPGRYVITACQSDTPVNEPFLETLLHYCERNQATLIVFGVTHTTPETVGIEPTWNYPVEFMRFDNMDGGTFKVLAGFKTSLSVANPLGGLDELSRGKHIIVPHTQLQMKTLATLDLSRPIFAYTTGAITQPNYPDTKSGYRARKNHSFSALYVQADEGKGITHIRVLNADASGSFYDLDRYYSGPSDSEHAGVSAVVTGDEHALFADPSVVEATYGTSGMVRALKPAVLARHDVLDFYSASHHHTGVLQKYRKMLQGNNNVENELAETAEHILRTTPPGVKNIIVGCNHNDHLTKWLNGADPKQDLANARIYHWLMWRMLEEYEKGRNPHPFELFVHDRYPSDHIEFADRNKSIKIQGIEIAQHGDIGQNGSRGSPTQFSRFASKHIIGHSHSPKIERGCYQVGTSTGRLEYANGYSTWANTHCVIYPNGTRQLITIIDGEWR